MNAHELETQTNFDWIVQLLFAVLAVLQLLDWHSSLSAGADKFETSLLINWLSNGVGFGVAMSLVKLGCLGVMWGLHRSWSHNREEASKPFIFALIVLIAAYLPVVANNYA